MDDAPDPRRRRSPLVAAALLSLVLVLAVVGIVVAVRGVVGAHRKAQDPAASADPRLSRSDRAALGVPDGVGVLWDREAASRLGAYLEEQLAGAPTRFYEINIYTDYAFATSVDATDPSIAVHAEWRGGQFTLARVGLTSAPGSLPTFLVSDVRWDSLGSLMDDAVKRLEVSDADVRYLSIDAGLYGTEGLTLRFYSSGPSSPGGYVVYDGAGAVVRVVRDGR